LKKQKTENKSSAQSSRTTPRIKNFFTSFIYLLPTFSNGRVAGTRTNACSIIPGN
jgi:hypothetical protein